MEKNDKIKALVFRYLDGLFENIDIQDSEYGIRGEVGNTLLFTYFPTHHRIFFSVDTIRMICNMFGISEGTVSDYVKLYLSKNVKSSLITAAFFPCL